MNTKKKYFRSLRDYGVAVIGLVSILYLLNFTFGYIEFLPDTLPIVGNIDEAFAVYVLYSVLGYFNINVPKFLTRK